MTTEHNRLGRRLSERLTTGGFRFTPQRERVCSVMLKEPDQPLASVVSIRIDG
jgi:Fe2+ or Zn2+ uptake regulation protein